MTGIHETNGSVHPSVSDFTGKDTSQYRIRIKTVDPDTETERKIYKVDSKLKQTYLKVLSTITFGLTEKPKYLKSHELTKNLSETKIDFKNIHKQHSPEFVLATIALKKELTTTNDPAAVLENYSDTIKHQVVQDLIDLRKKFGPEERVNQEILNQKINDPEFKKIGNFSNLLIEEYEKGTNFETGKKGTPRFESASLDERIQILRDLTDKATAPGTPKDDKSLITLRNTLFGSLKIEDKAAFIIKIRVNDPMSIDLVKSLPRKDVDKLLDKVNEQQNAARKTKLEYEELESESEKW